MLVAACNHGNAAAAQGQPIACAVGGASAFTRSCTLERASGPRGAQIVVRDAAGGFRRFDVLSGGREVAAADGAQPAKVVPVADGIEVTVGADRYRLPAATVRDGTR